MAFSRESASPWDFTDEERKFRASIIYINGNEPSPPAGFGQTDADDQSVRYNHCARFFYQGQAIGAVSWYSSERRYFIRQTIKGESWKRSTPLFVLVSLDEIHREFQRFKTSGHAAKSPLLEAYTLDEFIADVRSAFAFYCQWELDTATENTGERWATKIAIKAFPPKMALTELTALEVN